MSSYCLKCGKKFKKNMKSKNSRIEKTTIGRIMLSSNCAICGSKILRFIKDQEASAFLEDIGKAIISPFATIGKVFAS